MSAPRNRWKLPQNAQPRQQCQECVDTWKRKANKHSYNAQRLKYALMCFLEGEATQHPLGTNTNPFGEEYVARVPIDDDPVFTIQEDMTIEEQKKENELYQCGVCQEKMVKCGKKKPIIYQCGHSNCAECFNAMIDAGHLACPYCKKSITKAIRLYTLDE